MTPDYRNAIQASSLAGSIANDIVNKQAFDINSISITLLNAGIELNKISYLAKQLSKSNKTPIEVKKNNIKLNPGQAKSYLNNEFVPKVNFPAVFNSVSPTLVSHIGAPEKFASYGIDIQAITEVQLRRNIILSSEINYSIYNNFEDTISGPDSLLEHVRTEIVQYLKESELYINRLQLDYFWASKNQLYGKLTIGILESMYAGYGGEILYKPFNSKYSIGLNLFHVKQREFDRQFDFLDYKTTTGHISFSYHLPKGIEPKISYGRYLAKDDGFTFDVSRRTKSGFIAGVYFTKTDVPAEIFGEGSFDKGFYFQIPIDLFSKGRSANYTNFRLSPLTRDGGSKLEYDKDLRGLIYNSSKYELFRDIYGFNQ